MSVRPQPGQVWEKNGSDRRVRIHEVDYRWAEVRNVDTGRLSRIELNTLCRRGKAGWTQVDDQSCPGRHREQCCGNFRLCLVQLYGEEALS